MKRLLNLIRKENGQTSLGLALIMVAICALIIPSLLSFTTTSLNVARAVDSRALEFYSADTGIEDALWKLKNDQIPDAMKGNWDESDYQQGEDEDTRYTYNLGDEDNLKHPAVNVRSIEVVMKPVWVLDGLEVPNSVQHRTPNSSLMTVSNVTGKTSHSGLDYGVYQIGMIYDNSQGALKVDRIGFWLPPGFTYRAGSSNLEDPSKSYYCVPTVTSFRGGTAIFWETWPKQSNSNLIDYTLLPGTVSSRVVTFEFSPYSIPENSFSWMKTNLSNSNIYLAWDTDKKFFELTSTATSDDEKFTTLTAYTSKREFRKLGSGTEGDYHATGCTLMRNTDTGDATEKKDRLYKETPANVTAIPSDAKVEKIFLYWSGWKCKPWNAGSVTVATVQQKNVDKVKLQVDVGGNIFTQPVVTAATGNIQVMPNGSNHGWSYSCWADVTDIVKNHFGSSFNGNAKYTVGHWDMKKPGDSGYSSSTYRYALHDWKDSHSGETQTYYTRYPLGSPRDGNKSDLEGSSSRPNNYENTPSANQDEWAYAAWSVVIIYSSPSTAGHQLFIYDDFQYCDNGQTLTFLISGFLAPQEVLTDPNAARLTAFVAEGDNYYTGDKIGIIGQGETTPVYLSDTWNPVNNVWNSRSRILLGTPPVPTTVDGVDIDTFPVAGVIQPGDNQATVKLPSTGTDSWNLVYIILSFRSKVTTGGITTIELQTGGP